MKTSHCISAISSAYARQTLTWRPGLVFLSCYQQAFSCNTMVKEDSDRHHGHLFGKSKHGKAQDSRDCMRARSALGWQNHAAFEQKNKISHPIPHSGQIFQKAGCSLYGYICNRTVTPKFSAEDKEKEPPFSGEVAPLPQVRPRRNELCHVLLQTVPQLSVTTQSVHGYCLLCEQDFS